MNRNLFYADPVNEDMDAPIGYQFPYYKDEYKHWIDDINEVGKGYKMIITQNFHNHIKLIDYLKISNCDTVETIGLNHDGTIDICDNEDDEDKVILDFINHFPNLVWVSYCGYYANPNMSRIKEIAKTIGRDIFIQVNY